MSITLPRIAKALNSSKNFFMPAFLLSAEWAYRKGENLETVGPQRFEACDPSGAIFGGPNDLG